jgi:hypothetical protein
MPSQIRPITIASAALISVMAGAMAHTGLKAALNLNHLERPAQTETW